MVALVVCIVLVLFTDLQPQSVITILHQPVWYGLLFVEASPFFQDNLPYTWHCLVYDFVPTEYLANLLV
jgi:hypothetical protein